MRVGRVFLWIPAALMVAATAVFATWMVMVHYHDEPAFMEACVNVLVMLSPFIVYLVAWRLKVTRKTAPFGGGWSVLITSVVCTAIVVLVASIATAFRELAFQVDSWEIYAYYLLVSVAEETYYRLVLCWGILALLSSKHAVAGILGATATTVLGLVGGFQEATPSRAAWVGISIVAFALFYIAVGRKERRAPAWAVVVSVSISAATFSLAHWNVYQHYPEMLWATLIGGATMAAFLVATKNPFVPFIAHFCNNLAALRGVIIN